MLCYVPKSQTTQMTQKVEKEIVTLPLLLQLPLLQKIVTILEGPQKAI